MVEVHHGIYLVNLNPARHQKCQDERVLKLHSLKKMFSSDGAPAFQITSPAFGLLILQN